jgi:signal transduction histidine kinase
MVKKHLKLERQDESPPAKVLADREKVLQILTNLLSNAIRHSPPKSTIVLESARHGDKVVLSVRDSGPGIPADKLEEIFHPFVQVEDTYVGQRQGTGLGLSISRELARGMQGDVAVESEPGKGATFRVTLPAAL